MTVRTALTQAARGSLKALAVGIDRVRPPERGITVLIYHRVGSDSGGQMNLTRHDFERQLAWLSEHCDVLTLDAALDQLSSPVPPSPNADHPGPARPQLVITFDDGTTDWVDQALPMLAAFDLPATFYVATSFVEDQVDFPMGGRPLTWAGVKELASTELATIGSHTHTHLLLDRVGTKTAADELDRSLELLSTRANVTATHFAYPKAVAGSPQAQTEIRRRFRSAAIAGTRANPPGVDPHLLFRSPIQPSDALRYFNHKALGGMRAEDDLRSAVNRLRYRKLDS